jgi:hypothetical protein
MSDEPECAWSLQSANLGSIPIGDPVGEALKDMILADQKLVEQHASHEGFFKVWELPVKGWRRASQWIGRVDD